MEPALQAIGEIDATHIVGLVIAVIVAVVAQPLGTVVTEWLNGLLRPSGAADSSGPGLARPQPLRSHLLARCSLDLRFRRQPLAHHVGVLSPMGTVSRDLARVASWAKPIRVELLAQCQMPDEVQVPGSSRTLNRPASWK